MLLSPYLLRKIASKFSNSTTSQDIDNQNPSEHAPPETPLWLCFLNSFGGGCFLSVSLLEFVPIVLEKTPKFKLESEEVIEFPLGLFCIGIGFLILALRDIF